MSDIAVVHEGDTTPLDMEIAKRIAEEVMKHYPGYLWATYFNSKTGVGNVKCLNLSGTIGFMFKDSDIDGDPSFKVVVRGCGELLERFRQRRGAIDHDAILSAPSVAGMMIFDYHEAKNGKVPAIIRAAYDLLG